MGKKKYKKIQVEFLFEIDIPEEIYRTMDYDDRARLEELNRLDARWKMFEKEKFIFFLGDLHRVANVLEKYDCRLIYPKRTYLKKYGLTYSGDSLDIKTDMNDFIIVQRFPDGKVKRFTIPKKRVWSVYYIIKRYFEQHPDVEKVASPVIWELIADEFRLDRFFTRGGFFKKDRFFGNRRTYYTFAYLPLKVLEHIGKIRYEGKYIYNPFIEDEGDGEEEENEENEDADEVD